MFSFTKSKQNKIEFVVRPGQVSSRIPSDRPGETKPRSAASPNVGTAKNSFFPSEPPEKEMPEMAEGSNQDQDDGTSGF